jgi:hypothetical protein
MKVDRNNTVVDQGKYGSGHKRRSSGDQAGNKDSPVSDNPSSDPTPFPGGPPNPEPSTPSSAGNTGSPGTISFQSASQEGASIDANTPPSVCAALQKNGAPALTWRNGNCQYGEAAGAAGAWTYNGNGHWTLTESGSGAPAATVTFNRADGVWYQTVEERTAWGMQTTYRRMGADGTWTPVDAIPGMIAASGALAGSSPAPLRWRRPAVRPAAALPQVQAYAARPVEPRLPAAPTLDGTNNTGTPNTPNQTDNNFKEDFANLDEYMTYLTDLSDNQKAVFLIESVEIFDQLSNEQKQVICRGLPDVVRSILNATPGGGCRSAGL